MAQVEPPASFHTSSGALRGKRPPDVLTDRTISLASETVAAPGDDANEPRSHLKRRDSVGVANPSASAASSWASVPSSASVVDTVAASVDGGKPWGGCPPQRSPVPAALAYSPEHADPLPSPSAQSPKAMWPAPSALPLPPFPVRSFDEESGDENDGDGDEAAPPFPMRRAGALPPVPQEPSQPGALRVLPRSSLGFDSPWSFPAPGTSTGIFSGAVFPPLRDPSAADRRDGAPPRPRACLQGVVDDVVGEGEEEEGLSWGRSIDLGHVQLAVGSPCCSGGCSAGSRLGSTGCFAGSLGSFHTLGDRRRGGERSLIHIMANAAAARRQGGRGGQKSRSPFPLPAALSDSKRHGGFKREEGDEEEE